MISIRLQISMTLPVASKIHLPVTRQRENCIQERELVLFIIQVINILQMNNLGPFQVWLLVMGFYKHSSFFKKNIHRDGPFT